MALNTRDNRSSALGWNLPFCKVFPNPDAAINQGDRQQAGRVYRAILAAGAAVVTYFDGLTTSRMLTGVGH
jgi:hypothetical protein